MIRHLCLSLVVALPCDFAVSAQPKDPPKTFTDSLGMEFALVPKGKSWLGGGSGKEGTKEVKFAHDFYLGAYAVTQEEWQKIMGKNPSHFSRGGKGADAVKDIADADLKRFPVENVSWDDLRLARVPSGGDKKDDKKDDEDKLQGEWVIVSAETSDKSFVGLKDKKVLVKGSEWTEPIAKKGPMVKFSFKIDPTKNPKQLDLMATLGGSREQVKEQTWRGIYKIDGNTLTFCRGFPEGERPTEFKSGPKALLMVLQRAGN
jgi:uncharacterized protein (TIGR03067 family)